VTGVRVGGGGGRDGNELGSSQIEQLSARRQKCHG
jgi:hypothetical protein